MPDQVYPQPASLDEVLLRTVALALVARIIGRSANQQQTPEEQFLLEQRFRLETLIAGSPGEDDWQTLLLSCLRKPARRDKPLVELARRLDMPPAELLAVALAVEEDPWVGRVIAYVQSPVGGSRPTLGLLATAFAPLAHVARSGRATATRRPWLVGTIAAGRAMGSGVLQRLNESAPLPEQAVKIPGSLALALTGEQSPWPGQLTVAADAVALPPSLQEGARRHAMTLGQEQGRVLVIRTPSLREGASLVTVLAGAMQLTPLLLDAERNELCGLGPFCLVNRLLPVFHYELGPGEQRTVPELAGYDGPLGVLTGVDGTVVSQRGSPLEWRVPIPGPEERQALWTMQLGNRELAERLAVDHLHSAGRIAELAAVSRHSAGLRGVPIPDLDDIRQAAWGGEGGGLGAMAQPIVDRIDDEAMVLSPKLRDDLNLLLLRCRLRESLADSMGLTLVARYRAGVRSLFVGQSGTGKTLAAAWLATRLGMPLYGVDLAAVTSKYIGETEKNLSLLLARAEQADVILLFDEADSLFGKRTDIKEANDRFANAQTNYLLQRIEDYRGVVILTSNSKNRFDAAFTRRIDTIIEFPVPGPEERRDLWLAHLGDGHTLSSAELNQVSAAADLCGGHIRNAVLTAALLSRQAGRSVNYSDLSQGVKAEYKKLGRQFPAELMERNY